MRVLMIATNQEHSPYAVVPLGAAAVAAAVLRAGHTLAFLDLCFARNYKALIKKTLREFAPEIIGLSIRNLDNCSYIGSKIYYKGIKKIVETIQAYSAAPLVMGGGAVSVAPLELAGYLDIPYAFVGEGERGFSQFIDAAAGGRSLASIAGLLRHEDGQYQFNAPDFACVLDDLPFPLHDRIDYRRYYRHGASVGIQMKRGCPFRCIYCNYRTIEGSKSRYKSAGRCVDEMEMIIKDTGCRDFFFTDSVFNWPPEHALDVCEEIIRRGLTMHWMAYCNPCGLNDEMARAFAASGCAGIELGLDVVTEKMLTSLNKGFTQHDIRRAQDALTKVGIPFAVFLLFGGPGDSIADIEETQAFLQGPAKANAIFASLGMRIYRDAPLYDIALREGVITPHTDLLDPVYYVSSSLGDDAASRLDRIARRDPVWSTPTDWNSLLVQVIQKYCARFRVIPAWRDIINYGKYLRRQ